MLVQLLHLLLQAREHLPEEEMGLQARYHVLRLPGPEPTARADGDVSVLQVLQEWIRYFYLPATAAKEVREEGGRGGGESWHEIILAWLPQGPQLM